MVTLCFIVCFLFITPFLSYGAEGNIPSSYSIALETSKDKADFFSIQIDVDNIKVVLQHFLKITDMKKQYDVLDGILDSVHSFMLLNGSIQTGSVDGVFITLNNHVPGGVTNPDFDFIRSLLYPFGLPNTKVTFSSSSIAKKDNTPDVSYWFSSANHSVRIHKSNITMLSEPVTVEYYSLFDKAIEFVTQVKPKDPDLKNSVVGIYHYILPNGDPIMYSGGMTFKDSALHGVFETNALRLSGNTLLINKNILTIGDNSALNILLVRPLDQFHMLEHPRNPIKDALIMLIAQGESIGLDLDTIGDLSQLITLSIPSSTDGFIMGMQFPSLVLSFPSISSNSFLQIKNVTIPYFQESDILKPIDVTGTEWISAWKLNIKASAATQMHGPDQLVTLYFAFSDNNTTFSIVFADESFFMKGPRLASLRAANYTQSGVAVLEINSALLCRDLDRWATGLGASYVNRFAESQGIKINDIINNLRHSLSYIKYGILGIKAENEIFFRIDVVDQIDK